jgi:hypothetical protein
VSGEQGPRAEGVGMRAIASRGASGEPGPPARLARGMRAIASRRSRPTLGPAYGTVGTTGPRTLEAGTQTIAQHREQDRPAPMYRY